MKPLSSLFQIFILFILTVVSVDAQSNMPTSVAPGKTSLTFYVQAYRIDGETFLPPERLSAILASYTGNVDLARIQAGVGKVREIYNQAGYTNITVFLPLQKMTNGIVIVKVIRAGVKERLEFKQAHAMAN